MFFNNLNGSDGDVGNDNASEQSEVGENVQVILARLNLRLSEAQTMREREAHEAQTMREREAHEFQLTREREARAAEKEAREFQAAKEREERDFQMRLLEQGITHPIFQTPNITSRRDASETRDKFSEVDRFVRLISKTIPPLPRDKAEMANYFGSIEAAFKRYNVPDDLTADLLFPLLGEYLKDFEASQRDATPPTYEVIKKWVEKNCNITPEQHLKRWNRLEKVANESWAQVSSKIRGSFKQYLESRNVKTFQDMVELSVCDKLKSLMPAEMKAYILMKEGTKWVSADEISDLAESYQEAKCTDGLGYDRKGNRERRYERSSGEPRSSNKQIPEKSRGMYEGREWSTRMQHFDSRGRGNQMGERSKLRCYTCGGEGHIARACVASKEKVPDRRGPERQAFSNLVQAQEEKSGDGSQLLTARIVVSNSAHARALASTYDKSEEVDIKCGRLVFKGVRDSGAQISVVRKGLVDTYQEKGNIKIASAFGEVEIAPMVVLNMQIDDGHHGEVPITCAVSKKLACNMLISPTAYDALKGNVQLQESKTHFAEEEQRRLREEQAKKAFELEEVLKQEQEGRENEFRKFQEAEMKMKQFRKTAESRELEWREKLNEKESQLKAALEDRDRLATERDALQSSFHKMVQLEKMREKSRLLQSPLRKKRNCSRNRYREKGSQSPGRDGSDLSYSRDIGRRINQGCDRRRKDYSKYRRDQSSSSRSRERRRRFESRIKSRKQIWRNSNFKSPWKRVTNRMPWKKEKEPAFQEMKGSPSLCQLYTRKHPYKHGNADALSRLPVNNVVKVQ